MVTKIIKNNQVISQNSDSYNDLNPNTIPLVNNVPLVGNRTSGELGMYTKAEVDQLISQINQKEVIPSYPANPVEGTLYYVGTQPPYATCVYVEDSSGVLQRIDLGSTEQDMGSYQKKTDNTLTTTSKDIVGAINENKTKIDLKQNITDDNLETTAKTVVGAINEVNTAINNIGDTFAPLADTVNETTSSTPSCNNLVFRPKGYAGTSGKRIVETRVFVGSMTDPLNTSSSYSGTCKVTAYAESTSVYFEQYFVRTQSDNTTKRYEFYRKGVVNNLPATGSISVTWQAWIPIEYPQTDITLLSGYTGPLTYSITGGVVTVTGLLSISTTQSSWTKITNLTFPNVKLNPSASNKDFYSGFIHNFSNNTIRSLRYQSSTDSSATGLRIFNGASGTYFASIQIPLGY